MRSSTSNWLLFLSCLLSSVGWTLASSPDHPTVPTAAPSDHQWIIRFLSNLFSYGIVMFPGVILVLFVRSQSCPLKIRHCFPIRVFVFGEEEHQHTDVEQQDVCDVEDDKSAAASTSFFEAKRMLKFAYCFVGLQVSYLMWGLLQEKIMTTNYILTSASALTASASSSSSTPSPHASVHQNGSHIQTFQFHDSQFLVLVNRVLATLVAVTAMFAKNRLSRRKNYVKFSSNSTSTTRYSIAPLYEFSFCSVSNILSSWCQYEALKYVNFPTQVLSKACKLLPVMIMSTIISGKKYKLRDYVIVIVVSCGMFFFLLGNDSTSANRHDVQQNRGLHQQLQQEDMSPHHGSAGGSADELNPKPSTNTKRQYSLVDGLMILALYLTFDSFTSNWQEKLNSKYQVSPLQMMAVVNCFSVFFTLTSLAQQSHLIPSLLLVLSNSELTRDCLLTSLFSATGQLMIFYTISEFGALAFAFIMTLRQMLAIILSCITYGHALNETAITGILIVFVGLFAQIYFKSRKQ